MPMLTGQAHKGTTLCRLFPWALLFASWVARAGTITGQITTATGGPVANGTLTFTLNQAAVASGTSAVVPAAVNCYTDAAGNVVGLPNPLAAPVLSVNLGSGSLAAGTYYVVYAWANATGTTFYSPESSILLTGAGTLTVPVPASPPAGASAWKIFIGTTPGGETLQASLATPFSNYSQAAALANGAALPASNTSVCSLRFNDELIPSFTRYSVALKTTAGATVAGFPMFWQLFGGSAGTVNVANGYPVAANATVYPFPIIANPTGQGLQSINGALSLGGNSLTAGAGNFTSGLTVNHGLLTDALTISNLQRDCRIDGNIDTSGVNDASGAINLCIANGYTSGQMNLILPCGKLLISSSINLTNRYGMHLSGCSGQFLLAQQTPLGGVTLLLCNTGTVCVDTTGGSNQEISNLELFLAGTGISTPTPIGILQGRDAAAGTNGIYCFESLWHYHNLHITDFGSTLNTTANNSRGYIGIYNFGAENGFYDGIAIHTATPIVLTKTNVASISSPYQTIGTNCPQSTTMDLFDNVFTDSSTSTSTPNIEAESAFNMTLLNHEFIGGNAALKFEGSSTITRWLVTGAQESLNLPGYVIRTTANINDSHFYIYAPPATANINPEANNLTFQNNDFGFNTDNTNALVTNTATGITIIGGAASITGNPSYSNTLAKGVLLNAPTFTASQLSTGNFAVGSSFFMNASNGQFSYGTIFANNFTASGNGFTATQCGFNGDFCAVRDGTATNGAYFFGTSNINDLDFGVSNSGVYTLAGGSGLIISQIAFSGLGSPVNGTIRYCSDCTLANPCGSGGTGAIAKRLNGVWVCN